MRFGAAALRSKRLVQTADGIVRAAPEDVRRQADAIHDTKRIASVEANQLSTRSPRGRVWR